MAKLQRAISTRHGQISGEAAITRPKASVSVPPFHDGEAGYGGGICPPNLRFCPPADLGRANPGPQRGRIDASGRSGNQVFVICSQLAGNSEYGKSGYDRQVWAGWGGGMRGSWGFNREWDIASFPFHVFPSTIVFAMIPQE